jgi:hypothetical protein
VRHRASYVKGRADALAEEFLPDYGLLSDDRLLLLTAIMIADELYLARESLSASLGARECEPAAALACRHGGTSGK